MKGNGRSGKFVCGDQHTASVNKSARWGSESYLTRWRGVSILDCG